MRKSRKETLSGTGLFHKMWRGHNGEAVLKTADEKAAYLCCLGDTYTEEIKKMVDWYSFCLMSNHPHETGAALPDKQGSFDEAVDTFGCWMRNGHSRFATGYNGRQGRHGKVANERPKTTQIDDPAGVLQVMFYGDANPVAAGLVSHPSRWPFSSYPFYANGKRNAFTKHLTPPPAYLALGKTAEARRKKYRQLVDQYLRAKGLLDDRPDESEASRAVSSQVVASATEASEAIKLLPHAREDPALQDALRHRRDDGASSIQERLAKDL